MKTYAQTHEALRDRMEATEDWDVHVRSTRGPWKNLKVPYAQHKFTDARVWFKAQAIYIGQTSNLSDARSLNQLGDHDIRQETSAQTLDRIGRWIDESDDIREVIEHIRTRTQENNP